MKAKNQIEVKIPISFAKAIIKIESINAFSPCNLP
jgi:hypothetical protein